MHEHDKSLSYLAFRLSRCHGVQELVGRTKCGTAGADGRITMPPMCRLSMEIIERNGVYLVEDGFQASRAPFSAITSNSGHHVGLN